MNCEQVKPVLLDYVMAEVPAADRDGIAQHLETCAGCSEEAGKFRQTMSALAQGAAFEDIPQKIRIVAEPARTSLRWGAAFWRNPARLAFAGGALACVAVALLALASATITYNRGNFEIAFGAVATSVPSQAIQSPAAAPLSLPPSRLNSGMTPEQVEQLIAAAVSASEARQSSDTARVVNASASQAEANRMNDRRELAESFRYVQAAQVTMWKQQLEDQQTVSALLHPSGADAAARP